MLVAGRKLLFIVVLLDCSLVGESFTVSVVKDAVQNNRALFCIMPKCFSAAHFDRVTSCVFSVSDRGKMIKCVMV